MKTLVRFARVGLFLGALGFFFQPFAPSESIAADLDEVRKAAQEGNARAQNSLGVLYVKGDGVEQNAKEAVRWFRRAAKQGHVGSQYNLGLLYFAGKNSDRAKQEAAKWFQKAAENGHTKAQLSLRHALCPRRRRGAGLCQRGAVVAERSR